MGKRISALLLAVLLVAGSVLNGNTLKVKAAEVVMTAEVAAEVYLLLYEMAETGMRVSGANNFSYDVDESIQIAKSFQRYLTENAVTDFSINLSDGTYFQFAGDVVKYGPAVGAASTLTQKQFWNLVEAGSLSDATDEEKDIFADRTFTVFRSTWLMSDLNPSPSPSPSPTPTPTPEPTVKPTVEPTVKPTVEPTVKPEVSTAPDVTTAPVENPKGLFSKIHSVLLGAGFMTTLGAFVKDLADGKVDEVDNSNFYSVPYNNYNLPVFDYSYLSSSSTLFSIDGSTASYVVNPDPFVLPEHCYYACVYQFSGSDYDCFSIMYVHAVGNTFYYDAGSLPCIGTKYSDGSSFSANVGTLNIRNNVRLSTNIPFFDSHDSMKKFFNTYMNKGLAGIDVSGLLNGEAYDFPDLVKSVPEVLQPLTGTKFSPSLLPGINTAVSNAVKSLPETSTDTKANTETYKETMTSTITDVAPKTEVVPQPSTTPGTETGEGTEGEAYKRDLRLLFPFCIPFDFIHLIQALKAEPETPKFEIPVKLDFVEVDTSIVIDLSWMDPIMKIWRLGELGLFIVMLMKSTSKVIRW